MPGTGSLGGRAYFVSLHLSPVVVSLHLSPVVSQPGCLARLSGWRGSYVSLFICPPLTGSFIPQTVLFVRGSKFIWVDGLICLPFSFFWIHLFSVVSQPGCLARLALRHFPPFMVGRTHLSPFVCFPLSPGLDAWHRSWVDQPGCLARLFE